MSLSYRLFLSLLLLLFALQFAIITSADDDDIGGVVAIDDNINNITTIDNDFNITGIDTTNFLAADEDLDDDVHDQDDNFEDHCSYRHDFLRAHNRARHGIRCAPPLRWNHTLAHYARRYAHRCRKHDCHRVPHMHHYRYGHNVFIGRWRHHHHRHHRRSLAWHVVRHWVQEKRYYNYCKNTCARGHVCRHYTQVVWRHTTSVGCAVARCSRHRKGWFVVVCHYYPRGNIPGKRPYLLRNGEEADDDVVVHEDEEEEDGFEEELELDQVPLIKEVTDE